MSGKSSSASNAQNRTDSLIGTGVRIEGDIAFTGVLRILGDVRGNVSCDGSSGGTAVVGQSGNVNGTIAASRIIVGGKVHGPLLAAETIEIQQSGHVVGDATFQGIGIHAGGVIEGSLSPRVLAEGESSVSVARVQHAERSPVVEHNGLVAQPQRVASNSSRQRFGGLGKIAGATVLLIAVALIVLFSRDPSPSAPPPVVDQALQANVAGRAASSESQAGQPPVAQPAAPKTQEPKPQEPKPVSVASAPDLPKSPSGAVQAPAKIVAEAVAIAAPSSTIDTKKLVPAAPPVVAKTNSEPVLVVQGENPDKSANAVFVISEDSVVLFKKKLEDKGEGTRIELSQDGKKSIPIAANELLRVAKGRDVRVFYQGRKVPPSAVASGTWIRFEARLPVKASDPQ